MKQLLIFKNSEFGIVRAVSINDKPYFVGKDVATALGYAIPHKAIQNHCKGVLKWNTPTNGGNQEMLIIPEGDVYRLIVKAADQSKNLKIKDKAEQFEQWIFEDVLPSIRKNGMYVKEELLDNPNLLLDVITKLKVEHDSKLVAEKKLQVQAPKVEAYETMMDSKNAMYVREVAKLLNSKEWGEKRLYAFLRNSGVLMNNNEPYQKYVDRGFFRVIIRHFKVYDEVRTNNVTLVLPKGIDYILKLIKG